MHLWRNVEVILLHQKNWSSTKEYYMKNKPNKYGVKFYLLCDSKTSYILNCEIYSGSTGNVDNTISSVVQRLCSVMDRFYTSPALFTMLWENKTLAMVTAMKNRTGLPAIFKTAKLKKGETIFRRKDYILAMKWRDTRDVLCLSTKQKATSSTASVKAKGGRVDKSKPDAILDYQQLSYYPFRRNIMKW
ncbi:hypothetical protein PR048_019587 [Dryococelus australis]|uniref:PiggyBac transposable element-derived protein domain-containing protein n=1 Tax=Dryococelus australis TaxID=614101 RepID=A0ABQ9H3W0_9NEOP|nr:hypothetical protein PR048_019587 [Dryococelus australis]